MGKRSDFTRFERDYYQTPIIAVMPLLPHLPRCTRFYEPCAGDGQLANILEEMGGHYCTEAWDIEPQAGWIRKANALTHTPDEEGDCYITNPPWNRDVLHPLITKLSSHRPTWLLIDADWMHTIQATSFMPTCQKIVSIGRAKWIPDSPYTSMDNCCWYLFDGTKLGISSDFFARRVFLQ